MKLICTEVSERTGLVAISVETGASVERVRAFLVKNNVKPLQGLACRGRTVYDSRHVRDAFRDVTL